MTAAKNKLLRIAITTGDQDGIGPEVSLKALAELGPQRNISFVLWRGDHLKKSAFRKVDEKFQRITVSTWQEALQTKIKSAKTLIDIQSDLSPAKWVETSAQLGMDRDIQALVTAPISKTLIHQSGLKDIGHTDILKRISKAEPLFMTFLGEKFNVLLATGHIPLKDVSHKLDKKQLLSAVLAANKLRLSLKLRKPLALLGLNPHAGEQGIIGTEEDRLFLRILTQVQKSGVPIDGPLVPDAAFLKKNWRKYSFFICPYHDQGLIAFKMAHQHTSGCHLTMGLPFIRTSVEHGTAKDIFGKNRADSSSMRDAIDWAIKLAKS